jgi:membrane protease YdiL (CAAX protease family)
MNRETTMFLVQNWARVLVIPLVIVASLSLLYFKANAAQLFQVPVLSQPYIDGELKYQLITLGVAGLVPLATYIAGRASFRRFFRLGQIDAPVTPVKAIGLKPGPDDTWLQAGRTFALIITVVTAVFIYFQAIRGNNIAAEHLRFLPWILAFAVSNAFVEEMITRFAVVSSLDRLIPPNGVYLVSAAIFGLVHFYGTPGGIPGVLMAGFLGWLAAKSIGETRGVFWAWLIHFLQDVVIFTGLFFINL